MSRESERQKLALMREEVMLSGGKSKTDPHHSGKMTARERLGALLDADSFVELDQFVTHRSINPGMVHTKAPGEGVVTGHGTIDGRLVYVFSQDASVLGGSMGEMQAAKICKVMDLAVQAGAPLIGLHDSAGARIEEALDALNGYGEIFRRAALASGVIPQINVILGSCAGSAVFAPALGDFIFMVEKSSMFLHGPQLTKAAAGRDISSEELGGAMSCNSTGNAHFYAADETEALAQVRRLFGFLPDNNLNGAPICETADIVERVDEALSSLVPENDAAYDMQTAICAIADAYDFMQVHAQWAQNMLVGFIRLNGITTGVIANQPLVQQGELDIDAADKAARFIRFCDAFGIPLLSFVDTPGYTVGLEQEHKGLARHSTKLLYAYAEASVPKLTVILGKAYGNAYLSMGAKALGADTVIAWPSAQISIMPPQGAANIIYQQEIQAAENAQAMYAEKVSAYIDAFAGPYAAARRGLVDMVIEPEYTRFYVIKSLDALLSKKESRPGKKHGNMPC